MSPAGRRLVRHGLAATWMATRKAMLVAALAGSAGLAAAQSGATPAAPSAQQMIDALKPQGNRSRNLLVRPAAPPVAEAPAPTAPVDTAPPAPAPAPAVPPTAAPSPPPAAQPAPPTVAAPAEPETASGLSLAIQFETNSSRLQAASGPLLGELVAAMLSPELQESRFVIEGHTDARGNAAANQRLSQQRAEEVRNFLVALGVHPSRLRAVGKGSSEPVNRANPAAAENRRVRVVNVE